MSVSVEVKFFSKEKGYLTLRCIDELKYRLDGLDSVGNVFNFSTKELEEEYVGYVQKTIVSMDDIDASINPEKGLFLKKDPELYSKYRKLKEDLPLKDIIEKKEDIEKKYYSIFGWKEVDYNGKWYTQDVFEKAKDTEELKLEKAYENLYKLLSIKKSVDFYKLDEEQRLNLLDDIENLKEEIEDIKYKSYAYNYMYLLMEDYIRQEFNIDYNDKIIAYIYFD